MKTLLGTTEVSMTTAAAAVTAPTMDSYASTVVAGCQDGGVWIEWLRQKASGSTVNTPCVASKESIECLAHSGQTVFYAKLGSGTGTLYVEWWG